MKISYGKRIGSFRMTYLGFKLLWGKQKMPFDFKFSIQPFQNYDDNIILNNEWKLKSSYTLLLCLHKGSHKVCLRSRDLGEEAMSCLLAVLSCTPFCHLKSKKERKKKKKDSAFNSSLCPGDDYCQSCDADSCEWMWRNGTFPVCVLKKRKTTPLPFW